MANKNTLKRREQRKRKKEEKKDQSSADQLPTLRSCANNKRVLSDVLEPHESSMFEDNDEHSRSQTVHAVRSLKESFEENEKALAQIKSMLRLRTDYTVSQEAFLISNQKQLELSLSSIKKRLNAIVNVIHKLENKL